MSTSATTSASAPASVSASEIVPTIVLVSMRVRKLKGLNFGEESSHLGIHRGVSLIGGYEFGCVLGGGGCTFVLINLEAHHHFIYDGVGVVEYQFVNSSNGFPEFKVSLSEVVLEVIPCFVHRIGVVRTD